MVAATPDAEEARHGCRACLVDGAGAAAPVNGDREQTPDGVETPAHAAVVPPLGRLSAPAPGPTVATAVMIGVVRVEGHIGLVGVAVAKEAASQATEILRAGAAAPTAGAAPHVAQAAAP